MNKLAIHELTDHRVIKQSRRLHHTIILRRYLAVIVHRPPAGLIPRQHPLVQLHHPLILIIFQYISQFITHFQTVPEELRHPHQPVVLDKLYHEGWIIIVLAENRRTAVRERESWRRFCEDDGCEKKCGSGLCSTMALDLGVGGVLGAPGKRAPEPARDHIMMLAEMGFGKLGESAWHCDIVSSHAVSLVCHYEKSSKILQLKHITKSKEFWSSCFESKNLKVFSPGWKSWMLAYSSFRVFRTTKI